MHLWLSKIINPPVQVSKPDPRTTSPHHTHSYTQNQYITLSPPFPTVKYLADKAETKKL